MYYYDEEIIKRLRSYKLQIAACFLSIFALIITISLINDLYQRTYYQDNSDNSETVFIKSKTATLIYLLVAFYFTYLTFTTYKKNPSKRNYIFFITSAIATLMILIRYFNITRTDINSVGDVI